MRKDDFQNIKINKAMRVNFLEVCRRVGIKESVAIVKFITRTIDEDGFDIDLTAYDKISALKADSRMSYRIDSGRKSKFKELCEENGISVSGAVKLFMADVIQTQNMDKYFS